MHTTKLLRTNAPYLFNGMTQQLHSIVNALVLGHFLNRDVCINTWTADLPSNLLIPPCICFDYPSTNERLFSMVGLRSKLQAQKKDLEWISPIDIVQILWKFSYTDSLHQILDRLQREDMIDHLDVVDCFFWPLFHHFHSLKHLILGSLAALTPSKHMQMLVNQHKETFHLSGRPYYCVHLRLEDDWIKFRTGSVQSRSPARYSNIPGDLYASLMLEKVKVAIHTMCDSNPQYPIYVCTSLGKYPLHDTHHVLERFRLDFPNALIPCQPQCWTTIGLSSNQEAREMEALLDWFVARDCIGFVGFQLSTFSLSLSSLLSSHNIPIIHVED